jgi:SEC-C motif-containing protein
VTGLCPCGTGRTLAECCGPAHAGGAIATAEALMRARYSAFALGDADFILRTGPGGDRAQLEAHLARTRWVGLRVLATEKGGPADAAGEVEFAATFAEGGRFAEIKERSRFERRGGVWHYVGGDPVFERLEVGRNDRCPCGSGKKAKACHLGG